MFLFCSRLKNCGAGTDKAGVVSVRTGAATTVFCGANAISPDFVRSLAEFAGAHIYSSGNDVLYANSNFISFHAATPGRKTLRLPEIMEVRDVFSGQLVEKAADTISFESEQHSSRLFYVKPVKR